MPGKKSLAERGHVAALAYLERVGMSVVAENHVTEHGIIPILALDDDTFVHVTVHTYKGAAPEPAQPPTRTTANKHRKRIKDYLVEAGLEGMVDVPVRFDVITILVIADDRALLRHHKAAYSTGKEN